MEIWPPPIDYPETCAGKRRANPLWTRDTALILGGMALGMLLANVLLWMKPW